MRIYDTFKNFGWNYSMQKIYNKITHQNHNELEKQKIVSEYINNYLKNVDRNNFYDVSHNDSLLKAHNLIYTMWWQGEAAMPDVVKYCYNKLCSNAGKYKVILITQDNYRKYVDVPSYLLDLVDKKKIGLAHFSDIIRMGLLYNTGGLWLDSTILVTDNLSLHEELLDKPFFTVKRSNDNQLRPYGFLEPYKGFSKRRWTGFVLGTNRKNYPLFKLLYQYLLQYWKDHDMAIDYTFMDYIIQYILYNFDSLKVDWKNIPYSNPDIDVFGTLINESADKEVIDNILEDTFLYKLSYHQYVIDKEKKNSYWNILRSRLGD